MCSFEQRLRRFNKWWLGEFTHINVNFGFGTNDFTELQTILLKRYIWFWPLKEITSKVTHGESVYSLEGNLFGEVMDLSDIRRKELVRADWGPRMKLFTKCILQEMRNHEWICQSIDMGRTELKWNQFNTYNRWKMKEEGLVEIPPIRVKQMSAKSNSDGEDRWIQQAVEGVCVTLPLAVTIGWRVRNSRIAGAFKCS